MKKYLEKNKNNFLEKSINCPCGDKAKLVTRKNYPFGKNSKARILRFYKCEKCNKIIFVNKLEKDGRKENLQKYK
jgi:hypothetical protein